MCGVVGVVNLQQAAAPVEKGTLDRMTDAMRHRGPDARGVWVSPDGAVGLGHRRLSIVDLSPLGNQPMANEDQTVWLTFNGEIYNHQDLRARLERRGHRFRSHTDSEVLVHLYEEHGPEMVHHLDGDFAFVIWDDRRRRLVAARDRAGVKPLYYVHNTHVLAFASEIKALLHHPEVPVELDRESFYHYLTFLIVPPPRTLFRGISKLPAGGLLVLEMGEASPTPRVTQYWKPFPRPMTFEAADLDEELEERFRSAVRKRLMSDVPVGVLFSGGVDSTLNTVFFRQEAAPATVQSFTVGMTGTDTFEDERLVARDRAVALGTKHHEIIVSEADLIETSMLLPRLQDEPISDPVSVPLFFVTKLAKDHGVTVLHAGEGADEVFCGYDKYRRFMRQKDRLWDPICQLPRWVARGGFDVLKGVDRPLVRKIADSLRRAANRQEYFVSSAVAYYEYEKSLVLAPDFAHEFREVDSFDLVAPLYAELAEHCPDATFLQQMTFIELQLRLPELLLMRVDKMSMAHSVEVRVPFLDRDLLEFGLGVPDNYKLRDGVSKEPLKRMGARYSERDAMYAPKRGFGAPILDWFRGRLGREMRELMATHAGPFGEMLDLVRLDERLSRGPRTVNEAFQLWVVYNAMNWWNAFAEERETVSTT